MIKIIISLVLSLVFLSLFIIMMIQLYQWFPFGGNDKHWWIKHVPSSGLCLYLSAVFDGYNILAIVSLIIISGSFIAGAALRPKNNQNII